MLSIFVLLKEATDNAHRIGEVKRILRDYIVEVGRQENKNSRQVDLELQEFNALFDYCVESDPKGLPLLSLMFRNGGSHG